MLIAFTILFRILEYAYLPKTFYWILGSCLIELFISSIIWIDTFDNFFSDIRREIYRKYVQHVKEDTEKLELLRIYPFLAFLVIITKIFVLLDWTIWEATALPTLFFFTPYTMHFCSGILQQVYGYIEDDGDLPFHVSQIRSSKDDSPVASYHKVSVTSTFGYMNLFIMGGFVHMMTRNPVTELKMALICIGWLVHFSPALLGNLMTKKLKDLLIVVAVLNLGTFYLPFSQRILMNIIFFFGLALLRLFEFHFYSIQLTMGLLSFSFSILRGEAGDMSEVQAFIQQNWLFIVTLAAIILFEIVCLLSPTKSMIRNVFFFKDVNKFVLANILVHFIKMLEDVDIYSITLDTLLNSFQSNFKFMGFLIAINGFMVSSIIKFAVFTHTHTQPVKFTDNEPDIEPDATDCVAFLVVQDNKQWINDLYYLSVLRKTTDHMLIFTAFLSNVIFFNLPWFRMFLNYTIALLYSKGKTSTSFIIRLNTISFALQFLTFTGFRPIIIFVLEGINQLTSYNLLKAGLIAWKVHPFKFDTLRKGFSRGGMLDFIPQAPTKWQIIINGLVLFLVIVPLNMLAYYMTTRHYKSHQNKVRKLIEVALEIGGIVMLWILVYAPLYDSVFFLCISSYIMF